MVLILLPKNKYKLGKNQTYLLIIDKIVNKNKYNKSQH